MLIGHYAAAFGAKKAAPLVSLGWLVAAAILLDMIWPLLLLSGHEQVVLAPGKTAFTPLDFVSYPWSHSLAMSAVWGALFGGLYFAWKKDGRGALVLGALVVSHWVLDFLTIAPTCRCCPMTGSSWGWGFGIGWRARWRWSWRCSQAASSSMRARPRPAARRDAGA